MGTDRKQLQLQHPLHPRMTGCGVKWEHGCTSKKKVVACFGTSIQFLPSPLSIAYVLHVSYNHEGCPVNGVQETTISNVTYNQAGPSTAWIQCENGFQLEDGTTSGLVTCNGTSLTWDKKCQGQ